MTRAPSPKTKAFTLIEVIVVFLVLALLAAIAVVGYTHVTSRAEATAAAANLRQVTKASLAQVALNGESTLRRADVRAVMEAATGETVTLGIGAEAWVLGLANQSPTAGGEFALGFDNEDHIISDETGARAALLTATDDGQLFAQVFTAAGAGPIVPAEARVTPEIVLAAVAPGANAPTLSESGQVIAPPPVPKSPTGLSATWTGGTYTLTWAAGTADITSYTVQRATSADGPWAGAPVWTGTGTGATDTPPTTSLTWCYRVTATNAAGPSAPSAPVCQDHTAPPATPATPGVATGATTLTVSWSATASTPAAPVTEYRLMRQPHGGTTWTPASTITTGPETSFIDTPPASTHKTWCYRLVAVGDGGDSAPSAIRCGALAALPTAVATDVFAAGGDGQATVTWTAPGGQAVPLIDAEITVSPAPATGPATRMAGTGTPSFVFDGLTNGTLYTFTVKLANGAGTSATASAPTLATLPAPHVVSMTRSGTWTAPAGVTSVTVVAGGGKGGDSSWQTATGMGGNGTLVVARVTVVPGQAYAVTIAGGGAAGGPRAPGGKGGDAADLRPAGGALSSRILVAGGGGGGGNYYNGTLTSRAGGAAGPVGGSGVAGQRGSWHWGTNGAAGTQTSGAALGIGSSGGESSNSGDGVGGGGGGGGYWGGRGGSGASGYGGGGGGGSSYAAPGVDVLISTAGNNPSAAGLSISY